MIDRVSIRKPMYENIIASAENYSAPHYPLHGWTADCIVSYNAVITKAYLLLQIVSWLIADI